MLKCYRAPAYKVIPFLALMLFCGSQQKSRCSRARPDIVVSMPQDFCQYAREKESERKRESSVFAFWVTKSAAKAGQVLVCWHQSLKGCRWSHKCTDVTPKFRFQVLIIVQVRQICAPVIKAKNIQHGPEIRTQNIPAFLHSDVPF